MRGIQTRRRGDVDLEIQFDSGLEDQAVGGSTEVENAAPPLRHDERVFEAIFNAEETLVLI